jgi:nitrite reductase/ring-hydroxylating ferredoxin subunit
VTDPDLTRRRALAATALGTLSLPVLAACGGGGGGSSTAATDPGASSGDSSGDTSGGGPSGGSNATIADALVATSQVPVGGGVILADQNVVVTQPQKGSFQGFSATCTHQGCVLATVASGTINCGCHGSQFSITNGDNVVGPSGEPAGSVAPLPKIAVKVKGKDVVKA